MLVEARWACVCISLNKLVLFPSPLPCSPLRQEEAAAVTTQLEAAVAEHEAARAELGDVLHAWERDREELAEQIRWAGF